MIELVSHPYHNRCKLITNNPSFSCVFIIHVLLKECTGMALCLLARKLNTVYIAFSIIPVKSNHH